MADTHLNSHRVPYLSRVQLSLARFFAVTSDELRLIRQSDW